MKSWPKPSKIASVASWTPQDKSSVRCSNPLPAQEPRGRQLCFGAVTGMALTSHDAGLWDIAVTHYERAIDLIDQTPDIADWKTSARLRNNLAMAYREINRSTEAEGCYLKAIALYQAASEADHAGDLASLQGNLAYLYYDRGSFSEALAVQLKAVGLSRRCLAPDDLALHSTERRAGIFAYLAESGQQALTHFSAARAVLDLADEKRSPAYAELLVNIAAAKLQLGQTEAALSTYREAAELIQALRGDDDLFHAAVLNNQGCLYLQLDQADRALECFNRCLNAYKRNPATDDASRAEVFHNLSLAWEKAGNQGLADLYQRHATELLEHLTEDCRAKLIIASRSRVCVPSESATAPVMERPTVQTFSRLPSTPGVRTKVSRLALPIKTETIDWDF